MNKLESYWHFDRYLIIANYGLSEETNRDAPGADAILTTVPMALVSCLLVVVNVVKLPFEILAKIFAVGAGLCSKKACTWSQELEVSLTIKKIIFFAISLITNTIACAFCPLGHLSAWYNSKITEYLGRSATYNYMNNKLAKSNDKSRLEMNYDDVVKASCKIMPSMIPPTLCAFGYAAEAIQAYAKKNSFKVTEFHENNVCQSRKYTGLFFPTGERLCPCGVADNMYVHLQEMWKGERPLSSPEFNKHRWELVKVP